jgi:hypothetical protein
MERQMTRIFVVALGAFLSLAGLWMMWQGWDIVQVERGWTQVIAGATFVGSGVVTISIGLLIGALRARPVATLSEGSPAERKRSFRPEKTTPAAMPEAQSSTPAVEPEKAEIAAEHPAAALLDEPPPGTTDDIAPPLAREKSEHPGAWINEALASVKRDDLLVAREGAGAAGVDGSPDADAAEGQGPKIVGRYTIGGVNYTLHDDGSIEGIGPSGVVRFASLDELRAHIETESRRA